MKPYQYTTALKAALIQEIGTLRNVPPAHGFSTFLRLEGCEEPVRVSEKFVVMHCPKVGDYFMEYEETGYQCCATADDFARQGYTERVKDGIAGTHGGTLERGDDYVEVEAVKDGRVLAKVRVDCVGAEQARAVHQLADLWAAAGSDPEFFDQNMQRAIDKYAVADPA